jgi:carboxyl-terminal processing protease
VDGKPLRPVLSFSNGKPLKISYRRRPESAVETIVATPAFESVQETLLRATKLSPKVFSLKGHRIGYFHLWSGTHDAFLSAIEDVARTMSHTTDAMILDLRDGFGGADMRYIQPFFSTDLETDQNVEPLYTKPVIALINDGVRSGKEGLAYVFKQKRRAKLLGTTTAGHYLGGRLFEIIPNQFALFLAVLADPTAPAIEGKGVPPDITVRSPLPYSDGLDPELVSALYLIASQR